MKTSMATRRLPTSHQTSRQGDFVGSLRSLSLGFASASQQQLMDGSLLKKTPIYWIRTESVTLRCLFTRALGKS